MPRRGTGVVRFALDDKLVPSAAPETIVDGMAATNHPHRLRRQGQSVCLG